MTTSSAPSSRCSSDPRKRASPRRICRGTITSRAQYLVDVQLWGYEDARLLPYGSMSAQDASIWTAAIDEAESRPVGATRWVNRRVNDVAHERDPVEDVASAAESSSGEAPTLAVAVRHLRRVPARGRHPRALHRREPAPAGRPGVDRRPRGPRARRLRRRLRGRHADRRAGYAVHAAVPVPLRSGARDRDHGGGEHPLRGVRVPDRALLREGRLRGTAWGTRPIVGSRGWSRRTTGW